MSDMTEDGHIVAVHIGMDGKLAHHYDNNHVNRENAGELAADKLLDAKQSNLLISVHVLFLFRT